MLRQTSVSEIQAKFESGTETAKPEGAKGSLTLRC